MSSNKLKVTFIDNASSQYDGFADEVKYTTSKKSKGKLFIGDRHSCAMVQLKHRNCTAVINCDADLYGLAKEKDIRYLRADPCNDDDDVRKNTTHALKLFNLAYNFLDQELNIGHNVLVHCEKGITKSAAIIIYYLMKKQDISLAQAYKELIKYRAAVLPQPSLFRHLIAAEISLRGIDTIRMEGKKVIYLENNMSRSSGKTASEQDFSAERWFIGGVVASILTALFMGIYFMAGKL
jgi:predicted protein tyrosine phosphatase